MNVKTFSKTDGKQSIDVDVSLKPDGSGQGFFRPREMGHFAGHRKASNEEQPGRWFLSVDLELSRGLHRPVLTFRPRAPSAEDQISRTRSLKTRSLRKEV